MTTVALPAPVMPGTLLMTNGPLGTSPLNWRTPFTYRSTVDGTTAVPASVGTGNVTRSGRSAKLLRHCRPPRRSERVHASDDEIVSPNCVVVSDFGSDMLHDVS
ncbi:fimbrial biogenesis outer membrane usher domain protein [Burkholderia thailandensis E444]|nr:fimbrial biogenesis outer membrane usher domain protein [Burkholderia thailandensis E444]